MKDNEELIYWIDDTENDTSTYTGGAVINYEDICKKIGFTMEEYHEVAKTFKDDTPTPFVKLTKEERTFLMNYCKEHNI